LVPHRILGIPILEEAAPSGVVSEREPELYAQLQAAIDVLRCPSCGSLNYETTLFVFSTGVERMVECHNCGGIHVELLSDRSHGLLAFLPDIIVQGAT
jgi:hypothetical protein